MVRIAFLGAGSVRFTRKLVGDLLHFPELRTASLELYDIDGGRLETARRAVEGASAAVDATPAIHATLDRRAALQGADFVINLIQVGGLDATLLDFEVPRRYGIRYAINDTINTGGVMRGLRTIPVFIDTLREMADVCPSAWMLNYANPMAMVVGASASVKGDRVVGLCHSVGNTINQLAGYLSVPASEVWYESAGLNHLAFITRLERNGIDLYPKLRQVVHADGIPDTDLVRAELFMRFGLYPTESSEHHADYSPWFIPKQLIERFHIPLDELLRRDRANVEEYKRLQEGDSEWVGEAPPALSGEYAAPIIHAIVDGSPVRVVGNVLNTNGLITNLPKGICVEVPCEVDGVGVHPTSMGSLPPHCRAYISPAVETQRLVVSAVENEDRSLLYHAMAQDPQVQARLSLDEVWRMTDELLAAEARWLPAWSQRPA